MTQDRPGSLVVADWLLGALLVVYGVAAVLTLVLNDELVDAWSDGRADTASVEPPAFVAVAMVMFVVTGSLAVVLLLFVHGRMAWARIVLTAVVLILGLGTLALVVTGPPAMFLVLLVVGIALAIGTIGALWHRDTSAYLAAPAG